MPPNGEIHPGCQVIYLPRRRETDGLMRHQARLIAYRMVKGWRLSEEDANAAIRPIIHQIFTQLETKRGA